jgi:hypothetical protein
MALQFSTAVRNGRADAIETTIGTSAILKIRSGAPPATCATADSGTVIATINLASDWASASAWREVSVGPARDGYERGQHRHAWAFPALRLGRHDLSCRAR